MWEETLTDENGDALSDPNTGDPVTEDRFLTPEEASSLVLGVCD